MVPKYKNKNNRKINKSFAAFRFVSHIDLGAKGMQSRRRKKGKKSREGKRAMVWLLWIDRREDDFCCETCLRGQELA